MSSQEITKEVIIRGVLTSLIDVKNAPAIDPGSLVLFLENEATEWCVDNVVELGPLWCFCVQEHGWSEEFFQLLVISLQRLFLEQSVRWNLPTAVFENESLPSSYQDLQFVSVADSPQVFATPTDAFVSQRRALINWMVLGIRNSSIRRVIDPSKLRQFLMDSVDELWVDDAVQLEYLWDILSEPDEVTSDMVVGMFLIMEAEQPDEITVAISWPRFFIDFMSKLSVSQSLSFYKSLGLEPPESLLQMQTASIPIPVEGASFDGGASLPSVQSPTGKGAAFQRDTTGKGAAFEGHSTGSYHQKRISSALKKPSRKMEKRIKEKTKIIRKRKNASDPEQLQVPIWAVALFALLLIGGAGFYFLFKPASLVGQPMNVSAYSKFLPLQDLRINDTTVQVMPKRDFFLNTDDVQSNLIKTLYKQIKSNNGFVMKMAIFSTRGKLIRLYKPEAPITPPKINKRASAPRQ